MPVIWILPSLVALAAAGFLIGRRRALASAVGDITRLRSLPIYYGMHVALATLLPALLLLVVWLIVQPAVIGQRVAQTIPASAIPTESTAELAMADVRRIAGGLEKAIAQGIITEAQAAAITTKASDIGPQLANLGVAVIGKVSAPVIEAAQRYRAMNATLSTLRNLAVAAAALIGLGFALARTHKDFRARNTVERVVMGLLILASSIAILTTLGIVLSMVYETRYFFTQYPWQDFFFGVTWQPSFSGRGGASELGMLPLLWGTLFISLIALLVAVPVGLFAAIYLSEYAGPRMRAAFKPLLEVLAGIPTIVYGLFALITVGPMLRDYFAQPLGLGSSSASVMTAGLVMGIMLIPFVSSLSDDIITAVPQSMRDGSLGLGATRSETIRQVVIPAALPGIAGAVLLAASRAIGETMIVVLGAGAAARLSLNPFEAMTTVTVKIVSQLTGDTDFASPETLVAFALGLTLFAITLGLNVLALYIVRRYREKYE